MAGKEFGNCGCTGFEGSVFPHIRNKQSLDMDLVLICEKKLFPCSMPGAKPAEVLQRTVELLDADVISSSDSKLFLHFMGELLKTAGMLSENGMPDYEWFSDSLAHFDDFPATVNRPVKTEKTANPLRTQLIFFQ